MTLIKRIQLPAYLSELQKDTRHQVYLFFGERYLCRESADLLQEALLKIEPGTVHPIDGDNEDTAQTLARLQSFSLLPGLQIHRVTDSRIFHTKKVGASIWGKAVVAYESNKNSAALRHLLNLLNMASLSPDDPITELSSDQWQALLGFSKPTGDISWADKLLSEAGPQNSAKGSNTDTTEKYIEALERGLPPHNLLVLSAEEVDKRKKLFTYIKKNSLIIDCSVVTGASSAAQKSQRGVLLELVNTTLKDFKKKIEPKGLDIFFEKVGFHPVAVVMETEKLALAVGEQTTITCDDIHNLVGRSREDALFELTDHFGKKQLGKTFVTMNHLLDNGIHGLAILATMRNYLRRLLIFRSLQLRPSPVWHKGMNARQFQEGYLPEIKAAGEWKELLAGHPYALFMSFTKASEFSCPLLKEWLKLLLDAEFRLKSSPLPHQLVLEELFLTMLTGNKSAKKYP